MWPNCGYVATIGGLVKGIRVGLCGFSSRCSGDRSYSVSICSVFHPGLGEGL